MTGIKINGKFLVLNPGFKVTFEIENSAFSDDLIFSGYSIPGEAPVCDENNRILSMGYSLNVKKKVKQWPCEYYFKGAPVFYGTFNLLEASRVSYRWNMSISGLSAEFQEKNLKDIDYGPDFILGGTTLEILETINGLSSSFYPDANFCFPETCNPNFYGDYGASNNTNPDFRGYLNMYKPDDGEYARPTITQDLSKDNITAFSPWIFAMFILKRILASAGWEASGELVVDPRIQQLAYYGGRALDRTVEVGFVRAKSNPNSPQSLLSDWNWEAIDITVEISDVENRFAASKYEVPHPHPDTGIDEIGFFEIHMEWRAVFSTLGGVHPPIGLWIGVLFEGDDPNTQTILLDIIAPTAYDGQLNVNSYPFWLPVSRAGQKFSLVIKALYEFGDIPGIIFINDYQVKAVSLSSVNLLQNNVHYADHVPNMTVKEFLTDLKNYFNLSVTPNLSRRALVLDYVDLAFTRPPKNITARTLYDYNTTFNVKSSFSFNFKWSSEDSRESDNFKTIEEYTYLGEIDGEHLLPPAEAPNQIVFVTNANRYLLTVKDPANNVIFWKYYADRFSELVHGDGDRREVMPISKPVFMSYCGTVDGPKENAQDRLMPYMEARGNSPCFGLGTTNKQPLKTAIWYGMQPNVGGDSYPFATPYSMNDAGASLNGLVLTWDGSAGLYEKFWKRTVAAMADSELVEMDSLLALSELQSFDINAIYSVKDVYFAIKMMRITFGEFDIDPVEFEMFRNL